MKHKLFKILRIPAIHGDKFLWVQNSHKFLLATADRTLHQFMNDLSACIPYSDKTTLICHKPTHWFTAGKPDCAWEIFNHLPRKGCDMIESEPETFVLGMEGNQFIFVLKHQVKVTIICKDTVNHDWLGGEGLLTLEPQCTLTGDNFQLDTVAILNNNSEIVIPKLDIVSDWSLSPRTTDINLTTIALSNDNKVIELQKSLNETKPQMELIKMKPDFSYHDATHYSLFTIIIIGYICYKSKLYYLLCNKEIKLPEIDAPLGSSNHAGENVNT